MSRTEGKRAITMELSDILLNRFDEAVKKKGRHRSEVIRQLIDEYVERVERLEKKK